MQERLRTTYNLISKGSEISDMALQEELNDIRKEFTQQLRKPCGRMVLRSKRSELDRRVEAFKVKVKKHQELVQQKLKDELARSMEEIINACLHRVMATPPDELLHHIVGAKPTEEQAKCWLRWKLEKCFPTPDQLVTKMELEHSYKDVTYETLNEPGLEAALKSAFPLVPWGKPFNEFDTARAKSP